MRSRAERYYESIKDDRDKWKREQTEQCPRCWVCGSQRNLTVHEIAKRSAAPRKWGDRANYFLACNDCNCGVLEGPCLPHQYALKLMYDPEHYDRERLNVLRGRAPDAISSEDVMKALAEFGFYVLARYAIARGRFPVSFQGLLEEIGRQPGRSWAPMPWRGA